MTNISYRYPQGKIIIFSKEPVLGKVKTRLARTVGKSTALELHEKMLRQTVEMVCQNNLAAVELHISGNPCHPLIQSLSVEFNLTVHVQKGKNIGEKMYFALQQASRNGNYCVLIGTDCPLMDVDYLSNALTALVRGQDAVIGPSEDGGYVLIGARTIKQDWFSDISWGSSQVLEQSRTKLLASGARISELPTLWDVDQIEDLQRWQAML